LKSPEGLTDPIYEAIAAHQETARAVDTAHARILTLEPTVAETDYSVQAALVVEIGAISAMVATAPTTRAGLQVFTDYLREERQHHVGMQIDQTMTLDDGCVVTFHERGFGSIEKLIAHRAAELA
jgi:hypothetical protein